MFKKSLLLVTYLFAFLFPSFANALATVESRTGTPVVRRDQERYSQERYSQERYSNDSGNNRATALTVTQTVTQIEALQKEISELRGIIEVQDHEIKQLRKSQTDLFTHLEKKVNDLQTSSAHHASLSTGKDIDKNKNESAKTKSTLQNIEKPKVNESSSVNESSKLNENESFQKGYHFVRSKHYDEAILAFQEHLKRFPRGEQAPSALYWLAEVYFVQWQNDKVNMALLEKAREEFSNLESEFPNHTKASDALLKLGLIEIETDNMIGARQYLSDVKSRFPGTAAARIAETKLQQIKE